MSINSLKVQAGEAAVQAVRSGMVVGLGTGSTAVHAVRAIGRLLANGELQNVAGIPTSEATAREAERLGIPLTTFAEHPVVDVTIDGADEISPALDVIKGLGGALLREKIVAAASSRMIIVADASKQVVRLGTRAPVPVEVIPFAQWPLNAYFTSLGARPVLRLRDGEPYLTDEGNFIIDCHFDGGIGDPETLARALRRQPGVVEHGLFLGMAQTAVVAAANGVQTLGQAL